MTKKPVFIGIDPGWVNLGLSIVTPLEDGKVRVLHTGVYSPTKGAINFVRDLPLIINHAIYDTTEYEVQDLTIERYVPYSNTMTTETENITLLIGMILGRFAVENPASGPIQACLVRAIDWKINLAKGNAKHKGYQNPSDKLDKKFSISMAQFLTKNEYEFKSDHEADATCIASIPILREQGIIKPGPGTGHYRD